jgi:uncharacterized protein (TIGR03435 family)
MRYAKKIALALFIIELASIPLAHAQSSRPAFEVASVKPARPEVTLYGINFGSSGVTAHAPVNTLILNAYGLKLRQVEGDSPVLLENFDIDARAAANFVPPTASIQERNGQLRLMLQSLLEERFRLVMHKEVKDMPVYALVVAKGGAKLKPAPRETDCPMGVPCSRAGGGPAAGLLLPDTDIGNLVNILSVFSRRIVLDRTAIQGHFEIKLPPWTPPDMLGTQTILDDREPAPDPNGVSLFNVLEEHLGLRLQSTRAPVDIYVVDRLERPAKN